MIKVIASDMDGTLLGDNHKVAPETVEAIREAQAASRTIKGSRQFRLVVHPVDVW